MKELSCNSADGTSAPEKFSASSQAHCRRQGSASTQNASKSVRQWVEGTASSHVLATRVTDGLVGHRWVGGRERNARHECLPMWKVSATGNGDGVWPSLGPLAQSLSSPVKNFWRAVAGANTMASTTLAEPAGHLPRIAAFVTLPQSRPDLAELRG